MLVSASVSGGDAQGQRAVRGVRGGAGDARPARSGAIARSAAAWTLASAGTSGTLTALGLHALGVPSASATATALAFSALGGACAAFLSVHRGTGKLEASSRFLAQRMVATSGVARREAESSERERRLAEALAEQGRLLEQRLRERAVLFDVLRETVMSHDLGSVLGTLARRLAETLRCREVAVLLRQDDGTLTVRAGHGFANPAAVVGRSLQLGEGLTGSAAAAAQTTVVHDVAQNPDYLAFWGEVDREGSFLTAPILFQGAPIGMLALTRPASDPLTDVEIRYVEALANQVALAIRNAELFAELEALSTHDPLTGLSNRRHFAQRAEQAIAEAHRYHHPLSLLAIDIDHFKMLNDRCGHPAGDAVLVEVGRVLTSAVRATDTVARTGGEEFVVLLSHTDAAEATVVAEKLRHGVAAIAMPAVQGQPLGRLSISTGVSTLGDDDDVARLVGAADRALYDAKRLGRDRVSLSPPAP